jgi:hypothetical protein
MLTETNMFHKETLQSVLFFAEAIVKEKTNE